MVERLPSRQRRDVSIQRREITLNTTNFNDMSRAGLSLAREIAHLYSDDPRVVAVMAGGSVSRGCADEYSDVELGVFWDTPPSDEDRRAAALRMGGEVWKFDPSGGDRASEHIGLSAATVGSKHYRGTAMVSPVHLTLDTAEEWLAALIDDLDTAQQKYELAAAIRYGAPLYGHDMLRRWNAKAASFPDRLAVKLVQQNLWLGPWFNRAAYVAQGRPPSRGPTARVDAAGDSECAGSPQPRVPAVRGAQVGRTGCSNGWRSSRIAARTG